MSIVGASFNSPEDNAEWVEDQSYLYEVWSDSSRALAMHYGAAKGKKAFFPSRITLVLDDQGGLLLEYRSKTGSPSHPQQVLEDCQLLFGKTPSSR